MPWHAATQFDSGQSDNRLACAILEYAMKQRGTSEPDRWHAIAVNGSYYDDDGAGQGSRHQSSCTHVRKQWESTKCHMQLNQMVSFNVYLPGDRFAVACVKGSRAH
jgi:hypothetical protein